MKLLKIVEILEADVLCGEECLDMDIETACGSDLLSDVLAFTEAHSLLLTGLVNLQVIRTAELVDVSVVCFVRGKIPEHSIVTMAEKKNIPLLSTCLNMYEACGKLYMGGLARRGNVLKEL